MRYDEAVASLFQVPLEQFVVERKRLAGELKAAGDKDAAAKLAKLARPPISAWVVDQLWWHARAGFEALFETAEQLRDGKLDATAAHREAIAKLRAQAAKILTDAEHGATESTLRRVTQTLSALAASGGWDPDPPGALSADRDPPGFEAVGISLAPPPEAHAAHKADGDATHDGHAAHAQRDAKPHDIAAARKRRDAKAQIEAVGREHRETADAVRRKELEQAAERAEAAAHQRRAEANRAKATAEHHRLEAALRTARGDVAQREREVGKLERDLAAARGMVAQAKAVVEGLEERLAQLDS
jgi:hypothetical protein